MQCSEAAQLFLELDHRDDLEAYNYEHFRTHHMVSDFQATRARHGIQPGEMAPDFELLSPRGGSLRLSTLRGRPTLLHFGSPS